MIRGNRKLKVAWSLTVLVTMMLVVPSLGTALSGLWGTGFSWMLVGEGTWAAVITLVWGAYFGANVAEKHSSFIQDYDANKAIGEVNPDNELVDENVEGEM